MACAGQWASVVRSTACMHAADWCGSRHGMRRAVGRLGPRHNEHTFAPNCYCRPQTPITDLKPWTLTLNPLHARGTGFCCAVEHWGREGCRPDAAPGDAALMLSAAKILIAGGDGVAAEVGPPFHRCSRGGALADLFVSRSAMACMYALARAGGRAGGRADFAGRRLLCKVAGGDPMWTSCVWTAICVALCKFARGGPM
eukprot:357763-Chlamydomonas_euryale.AAC.1